MCTFSCEKYHCKFLLLPSKGYNIQVYFSMHKMCLLPLVLTFQSIFVTTPHAWIDILSFEIPGSLSPNWPWLCSEVCWNCQRVWSQANELCLITRSKFIQLLPVPSKQRRGRNNHFWNGWLVQQNSHSIHFTITEVGINIIIFCHFIGEHECISLIHNSTHRCTSPYSLFWQFLPLVGSPVP